MYGSTFIHWPRFPVRQDIWRRLPNSLLILEKAWGWNHLSTRSAMLLFVSLPLRVWKTAKASSFRRIWTWCLRRTTILFTILQQIPLKPMLRVIGWKPKEPRWEQIMVWEWLPLWRYLKIITWSMVHWKPWLPRMKKRECMVHSAWNPELCKGKFCWTLILRTKANSISAVPVVLILLLLWNIRRRRLWPISLLVRLRWKVCVAVTPVWKSMKGAVMPINCWHASYMICWLSLTPSWQVLKVAICVMLSPAKHMRYWCSILRIWTVWKIIWRNTRHNWMTNMLRLKVVLPWV